MHSPSGSDPSSSLVADASAAARWRTRRSRFVDATGSERVALLAATSAALRATVLRTISAAGLGHVGGDLSVTDILTTLFDGVLRIEPLQPQWAGRDRFILSKGHAGAGVYSQMKGLSGTQRAI